MIFGMGVNIASITKKNFVICTWLLRILSSISVTKVIFLINCLICLIFGMGVNSVSLNKKLFLKYAWLIKILRSSSITSDIYKHSIPNAMPGIQKLKTKRSHRRTELYLSLSISFYVVRYGSSENFLLASSPVTMAANKCNLILCMSICMEIVFPCSFENFENRRVELLQMHKNQLRSSTCQKGEAERFEQKNRNKLKNAFSRLV